jgi:hypothetical protein
MHLKSTLPIYLVVFLAVVSCRQKQQARENPQIDMNSKSEENSSQRNDLNEEKHAVSKHHLRQAIRTNELARSEESKRPTYENLEKAFEVEYKKVFPGTRSGGGKY